MYIYLVDVDCQDGEDHNAYFEKHEEAVEYAKKQEGRYCGIYKLVATKNEADKIVDEQDLVSEKSINELINIIHQKDLAIKQLESKNEKLTNKLMQISQVADLRDCFKN